MKESEINDDINKDIIAKGYDHSIFTKDYKCPISWGIEELMGTSLLAAGGRGGISSGGGVSGELNNWDSTKKKIG